MIGFVVQNFSSQPFLIKTQKYNASVKSDNTQLLYLFLKQLIYIKYDISWNIYFSKNINSLYRTCFVQSFWKFFHKMHTHNVGILTVNLTKSFFYETYLCLNNLLKPTYNLSYKKIAPLSTWNTFYKKPIYVLPFSFQKTTYNTIIFFLFFKLVSLYSAPQNDFKLYHSYVLRPNNFMLYMFLNLFYFRVQHF